MSFEVKPDGLIGLVRERNRQSPMGRSGSTIQRFRLRREKARRVYGHGLARIFSLVALVLAFSGCGTISDATDALRERLATREKARERTYEAAPRDTYEALRNAAVQMGYRIVRGGPAQGELEAISGVKTGESHGSARQLHLNVRLRASLDGAGTVVAVRLTEILEPDSSNRPGQATEAALGDTPQYEVLFEKIGQVLAGRKL